MTCTTHGSSPLTRGKRGEVGEPLLGGRLIPAHAGKTSLRLGDGEGVEAHPRSRGENTCWPSTRSISRGSSPLTRGKRKLGLPGKFSLRLIPAHAGKTCRALTIRSTGGAHPRSRGENVPLDFVPRGKRGSSPLTRGKRPDQAGCRDHLRLIPAHAGKTAQDVIRLSRHTAHPRSRGENASAVSCTASIRGSSPLTRGKRPSHRSFSVRTGLIPAHAGKTGD